MSARQDQGFELGWIYRIDKNGPPDFSDPPPPPVGARRARQPRSSPCLAFGSPLCRAGRFAPSMPTPPPLAPAEACQCPVQAHLILARPPVPDAERALRAALQGSPERLLIGYILEHYDD